jgi:hypothetical protein
MLRGGTTVVECKSGYGLDLETGISEEDEMQQRKRIVLVGVVSILFLELKLLEVLHEIQPEVDVDIVSTYLGMIPIVSLFEISSDYFSEFYSKKYIFSSSYYSCLFIFLRSF